jgi:hypothetical protein
MAVMASPAWQRIAFGVSGASVADFVIGTVAGLASVFLPRLMLLLSVDTEPVPGRYIRLVPLDFVWLGLIFAVSIGLIAAILEFGGPREPKTVFMAALGIPALLTGVLNTTSATGKLQKAEQEKAAFVRSVSDQAGITQESVQTLEPLEPATAGPGKPSSAVETAGFLVPPAFAESPSPAQQTSRFDPGIQIQRPNYVLVLKRANSAEEARRLVKELQNEVPTAQAVKTEHGYLIVDTLKPRSEANAVLDAIQLKANKKLTPSLLQVPK